MEFTQVFKSNPYGILLFSLIYVLNPWLAKMPETWSVERETEIGLFQILEMQFRRKQAYFKGIKLV